MKWQKRIELERVIHFLTSSDTLYPCEIFVMLILWTYSVCQIIYMYISI